MAGGYPCCCKTGGNYSYQQFGSSYTPPPQWLVACSACLGGVAPTPLIVEIDGISNGPNCSNAGDNNATYVIPFSLATLTTCVWTMTLPGNPPGQPICKASSILIEFITSGANMTINVLLYFTVREIRWSKYYPGVTTLFDCANMDESIPYLVKSPGLSVEFDNSPVRLVAPAAL